MRWRRINLANESKEKIEEVSGEVVRDRRAAHRELMQRLDTMRKIPSWKDMDSSINFQERRERLPLAFEHVNAKIREEAMMHRNFNLEEMMYLEIEQLYRARRTIEELYDYLKPSRWHKLLLYFLIGLVAFAVLYYGYEAGWFDGLITAIYGTPPQHQPPPATRPPTGQPPTTAPRR